MLRTLVRRVCHGANWSLGNGRIGSGRTIRPQSMTIRKLCQPILPTHARQLHTYTTPPTPTPSIIYHSRGLPTNPCATTSDSIDLSGSLATLISGQFVTAINQLTTLIQQRLDQVAQTASTNEEVMLEGSESSLDPILHADTMLSHDQKVELCQLLNQRSECFFRLDEYAAAMTDCEIISENLHPRQTELRAESDIDEVMKADPSYIVETNIRKVFCLLGLKRKEEARELVSKLLKSSAHTFGAHTFGGSYDKLVQVMYRCKLEEEQGEYDMNHLVEECFDIAATQTSDPLAMNELDRLKAMRLYPCVRMKPHGEFLHPQVEVGVKLPNGHGFGVRVRSQSQADDPAKTSTAMGVLPKHTLIMCNKSILTYSSSDDVSFIELARRKLKDQPELFQQFRRLHGDANDTECEQEREELMQLQGVESVWKQPRSFDGSDSFAPIDELDDAHLQTILHLNSFKAEQFLNSSSSKHELNLGGSGIWFLPSFLNHSCVPNCAKIIVGDLMFIRTIREVQPGEELTLAYTDTFHLPYSQRQKLLKKSWQFDCRCPDCQLYQTNDKLEESEEKVREIEERVKCEKKKLKSDFTAQLTTLVKQVAESNDIQSTQDKLSQELAELKLSHAKATFKLWADVTNELADLTLNLLPPNEPDRSLGTPTPLLELHLLPMYALYSESYEQAFQFIKQHPAYFSLDTTSESGDHDSGQQQQPSTPRTLTDMMRYLLSWNYWQWELAHDWLTPNSIHTRQPLFIALSYLKQYSTFIHSESACASSPEEGVMTEAEQRVWFQEWMDDYIKHYGDRNTEAMRARYLHELKEYELLELFESCAKELNQQKNTIK